MPNMFSRGILSQRTMQYLSQSYTLFVSKQPSHHKARACHTTLAGGEYFVFKLDSRAV
jgi:hypothetical protein